MTTDQQELLDRMRKIIAQRNEAFELLRTITGGALADSSTAWGGSEGRKAIYDRIHKLLGDR